MKSSRLAVNGTVLCVAQTRPCPGCDVETREADYQGRKVCRICDKPRKHAIRDAARKRKRSAPTTPPLPLLGSLAPVAAAAPAGPARKAAVAALTAAAALPQTALLHATPTSGILRGGDGRTAKKPRSSVPASAVPAAAAVAAAAGAAGAKPKPKPRRKRAIASPSKDQYGWHFFDGSATARHDGRLLASVSSSLAADDTLWDINFGAGKQIDLQLQQQDNKQLQQLREHFRAQACANLKKLGIDKQSKLHCAAEIVLRLPHGEGPQYPHFDANELADAKDKWSVLFYLSEGPGSFLPCNALTLPQQQALFFGDADEIDSDSDEARLADELVAAEQRRRSQRARRHSQRHTGAGQDAQRRTTRILDRSDAPGRRREPPTLRAGNGLHPQLHGLSGAHVLPVSRARSAQRETPLWSSAVRDSTIVSQR